MTALHPTTRPTTPARRLRHAVRHYLEMLAAMTVGMAGLVAVAVGLEAAGVPATLGTVGDALLMASAMALPMGAWMRRRGHSWRAVLEMAAAMYVPFVALFVPWWAGTITPDELMLGAHVLMLPAMAVAMLLRPHEYTCPRSAR